MHSTVVPTLNSDAATPGTIRLRPAPAGLTCRDALAWADRHLTGAHSEAQSLMNYDRLDIGAGIRCLGLRCCLLSGLLVCPQLVADSSQAPGSGQSCTSLKACKHCTAGKALLLCCVCLFRHAGLVLGLATFKDLPFGGKELVTCASCCGAGFPCPCAPAHLLHYLARQDTALHLT